MADIREMANPHDKITLDCADIDAARLAVLVVGNGKYSIVGDEMPLFIVGGAEEWISKTYGVGIQEFYDSVSRERLAAVLE